MAQSEAMHVGRTSQGHEQGFYFVHFTKTRLHQILFIGINIYNKEIDLFQCCQNIFLFTNIIKCKNKLFLHARVINLINLI